MSPGGFGGGGVAAEIDRDLHKRTTLAGGGVQKFSVISISGPRSVGGGG